MYKKVSAAPLHGLDSKNLQPSNCSERLTLARLRCPCIAGMLQSCATCSACQLRKHSGMLI